MCVCCLSTTEMGNSESFDLINIPENPQQPNTKHKRKHQSKKRPSHHHHSQTISSSLKSITSFDLNGIFRKINEEQNSYHPDRKSAQAITMPKVIASAPPQPEPAPEPEQDALAKESRPSSHCTDSSESSESSSTQSNYVESKIQEVISVTLTKSADNSEPEPTTTTTTTSNLIPDDEHGTESKKPDSVETVQQVEAVITKEEIGTEDIINLDSDGPELEKPELTELAIEVLEPVDVNADMVEVVAEAINVTVDTVEYESEVKIEVKTEEQEEESKNDEDQTREEEVEEDVKKCSI